MHFDGALTDNGLKIAFAPEGFTFDIVVEPDVIIGALGKNLSPTATPQTVFLVVVPEPATISLVGAAAIGLLIRRKRR